MSSWALLLAASVALQSLGEVAERERKRREENAEAGVEVRTYTSTGVPIAPEEPEQSEEASSAAQTPFAEVGDEDLSPLDEAWERGKILEPRMLEIARAANVIDGLYQRYLDECYGRYAIGATPPGIGIPVKPSSPVHVQTGRDWFIVLETPSALSTPVPTRPGGSFLLVELPHCQSLRKDIIVSANEVREAMRELLNFARQEGILPGVVRELRAKYRLEWSGWER